MTDKEKIELLISQSAPFTFLERWEDADFKKLITGIETLLKESEEQITEKWRIKLDSVVFAHQWGDYGLSTREVYEGCAKLLLEMKKPTK